MNLDFNECHFWLSNNRTNMNRCICQVSLILVLVAALGWPAKVLVFQPMPWKSHHFVYRAVIKGLALRGHEIDYLTARPIYNCPNVRNLLIKDTLAEQLSRVNPESFEQSWPPAVHNTFRSQVITSLTYVYSHETEVQKLLMSNETYDMVISEYQLYQEINAVWAHKFNATPVSLMAMGDISFANELYGIPDNPSYIVDFTSPFTDDMNFVERLSNSVIYVWSLATNYYRMRELQELADRRARYPGWEGRPPLSQLASDMALVLIGTDHAVGYSAAKAPHVKAVGGLTLNEVQKLPRDLQAFMDDAEDGVVYFSLGSMTDLSEITKDGGIDEILSLFRSQKQKFLVKWTGRDMPVVKDPSIRIQSWVPQLEILAHKNTKVFVTHGGLQSTTETIYFGVPAVGIPIFADQPKNVRFLVSRGCGLEINKRNLTRNSLEWAINEVLKNPRYKEAAMKRSSLMRDRPMKPVDEAVFWIEYVLRHGRILQPASVRMPFYQIYLFDVMAVVIFVLLTIFLVILYAFNCTLRCMRNARYIK